VPPAPPAPRAPAVPPGQQVRRGASPARPGQRSR
jgi:hypothetical protein